MIIELALLLTAANITDEPTKQESPEAVKAEQVEKAKEKVCRFVKVTGSRMSKKMCLTQEEWDELAEEARQET